ncbi:MAG: metallopeptidase family protein, partial [Pseudomonadota bacterium]
EQHSAPSTEPAIVFLYRMPILDEWAQRGDVRLDELIAHVVFHELGHHFGWSDEEMDAVLAGD